MKKILSLAMMLSLVCSCVSWSAAAQENQKVSVEYEYMEDGSYFVTVVEETPSLTRASNTTTGTKRATYCNASGVAQFTVKVTGTFSYNGSSASAKSVTGGTEYHVIGCSLIDSSKSMSGNSATATATINCKGTNVKKSVTLYCSANGDLS